VREEEERNRHTPLSSISEGLFFAATSEDLARVLLLLLLLLLPLHPLLLMTHLQAWGVNPPLPLLELVQVTFTATLLTCDV
jgi:hypothetical protein